MDTWILNCKEDIRIEKRPIPSVNIDEVLVNVQLVVVYGSDLNHDRNTMTGTYQPNQRFIMGNEFHKDTVWHATI